MKKLYRNILTISLIFIASLGLVSCNFNKKSDKQSNKIESNKSIDEQKNLDNSNSSDEDSTTIQGTKNETYFDTVEDALKNSVLKNSIAKTLPKNMKLTAKGNELIYTAEIKGLPKNEDSKTALKNGLKENENMFKTLANTMLPRIKGKEMSITVKYVNDKNELVYEQTNTYKK